VYGVNDFVSNGDGTVSDNATGLMWTASTDDVARNWEDTLAWVQEMNSQNYLGYDDWRLPNAKELHSIVQYGKSTLPAIDTDYFTLTYDDIYVWTSTTSGDFPESAMSVCFGYGWSIPLSNAGGPENGIEGEGTVPEAPADDVVYTVDSFEDAHGTGALRADYKSGIVPSLSAEKVEQIQPGKIIADEETGTSLTEEDLSHSENADDLVIIYNYALLVRDME
jgi:hypothetical protein